jgi:hypothetical protein
MSGFKENVDFSVNLSQSGNYGDPLHVDPDPVFNLNADPDVGFHFDADPDLDTTFHFVSDPYLVL